MYDPPTTVFRFFFFFFFKHIYIHTPATAPGLLLCQSSTFGRQAKGEPSEEAKGSGRPGFAGFFGTILVFFGLNVNFQKTKSNKKSQTRPNVHPVYRGVVLHPKFCEFLVFFFLRPLALRFGSFFFFFLGGGVLFGKSKLCERVLG